MQKNNILVFFFGLILTSSLSAVDYKSLLFHGNCITCHHEHKAISAPSIDEIKENYLRAFPLKKDFVDYMSTWIAKPNKNTSIMLDAIKKYELMPELGFDESTTRDIASYIYDTDFSKEHEGHKY